MDANETGSRRDGEEGAKRTVVYTLVGGLIGLGTSLFLRYATGSTCPLTCNPYVATPLAAFIGYLWARGEYP